MNRTIVIIHPGALGDVLLAIPAITRFRSRFPQHELVLCANQHVAPLLLECRVIDVWLSVEGSDVAEVFGGSSVVSGQLADWLKHCDLAVAWTQGEEGSLAQSLKQSGAETVHVGSPFSSTLAQVHQSDRFLEMMNEPPADVSGTVPLAIPDHWRALGRGYLHHHGIVGTQPLVFLHPGSGSIHKCVGPDVLAAVIERLRREGLEPLILEGPADLAAVARLRAHLSTSFKIVRGMDLQTLIGVLAHAQLYIGHDSGVTHLAALFGIQTLALFGPTDPARWAPRGAHASILRGSSCSCASWDAVRQCTEKPCLQLSPEIIIAHCLALRLKGATPGNTSRCALSLPTPYARVAS